MEAEELLKQLGEAIGLELAFDENGACAFEADGMTVTLNNFPELDRIVLSGDVGEPPPERLEGLYKAMLTANHLFQGTGGATLSLDPESGDFAINLPLDCRVVDGEEFVAQTGKFVNLLESWRKIVENYRDSNVEDSAGEVPPLRGLSDFQIV